VAPSATGAFDRTDTVQRVLGLQRLPDVSTWTRGLAEMTVSNIEGLRALNRNLVIDRLREEKFPRVTIDFDGSVLSTRGHAEGSAIGHNRNSTCRVCPEIRRPQIG